ncbi:PTS system, cellobiose-specific IIC component [Amphibacillus marinus]|uniref:Permease IIC component n=1 Tax=Amphibacillus marinus TaxID=872970 RepID=A0A1H8KM28_9BACI|nr:PTS sugar transporter subunit IIC [Amphibacillus marinus]SEN93478.1 PTS system, cellobiose-specific IIC component [Amphibacillus marinus]
MDKFMASMNKKLIPIAKAFDTNRYLDAIKNGFFGVMPFLIIGSFLLIFGNLPIEGYPEFMQSIFGAGWDSIFNIPFEATMNIMTLFVIMGTAKSLAKHYKINELNASIAAVVAFIILTPFIFAGEESGIPTGAFGATGLFLGLISAIVSVEILRFIEGKNITIKMPPSVPANISSSFTSLIPSFFVILVFTIIRLLFEGSGFGTAQNFIYQILQAPLTNVGSSLPAMIIINLFASLLWAFGIHGTVIIGAIMDPIWLSLTAENATAFAAGANIPNIINTEFQSNFVQLGGAGCTLGLVICMVFVAKSKQYKTLGKLSIAPSIFNINEPVIFGTPIILNPLMLIPFVVSTLVALIITYFTMATGLVPLTNGVNLPWTTPPIISGFLLSGWRGATLQVITTLITTAIWYPFFRISDQRARQLEDAE